MDIQDIYSAEDYFPNEFIKWGEAEQTLIFRHHFDPLVFGFFDGNLFYATRIELEEFESYAMIERMLPIYANAYYKYQGPMIYPDLSDLDSD